MLTRQCTSSANLDIMDVLLSFCRVPHRFSSPNLMQTKLYMDRGTRRNWKSEFLYEAFLSLELLSGCPGGWWRVFGDQPEGAAEAGAVGSGRGGLGGCSQDSRGTAHSEARRGPHPRRSPAGDSEASGLNHVVV